MGHAYSVTGVRKISIPGGKPPCPSAEPLGQWKRVEWSLEWQVCIIILLVVLLSNKGLVVIITLCCVLGSQFNYHVNVITTQEPGVDSTERLWQETTGAWLQWWWRVLDVFWRFLLKFYHSWSVPGWSYLQGRRFVYNYSTKVHSSQAIINPQRHGFSVSSLSVCVILSLLTWIPKWCFIASIASINITSNFGRFN